MMTINMNKVREAGGTVTTTTSHYGKTIGVVTIPAEGFNKLVGMCLPNGKWAWIHKDFRK